MESPAQGRRQHFLKRGSSRRKTDTLLLDIFFSELSLIPSRGTYTRPPRGNVKKGESETRCRRIRDISTSPVSDSRRMNLNRNVNSLWLTVELPRGSKYVSDFLL